MVTDEALLDGLMNATKCKTPPVTESSSMCIWVTVWTRAIVDFGTQPMHHGWHWDPSSGLSQKSRDGRLRTDCFILRCWRGATGVLVATFRVSETEASSTARCRVLEPLLMSNVTRFHVNFVAPLDIPLVYNANTPCSYDLIMSMNEAGQEQPRSLHVVIVTSVWCVLRLSHYPGAH